MCRSVALGVEPRDGPKGGMYSFNCESKAQQLKLRRRLEGLQVGLFNVVVMSRKHKKAVATASAVGGASGQAPTEKKKNDEKMGGQKGSSGELMAALFKLSEEVAGLRLEVRTLRVQTAETEVVEKVPPAHGNTDSGTTPTSTAEPIPKGEQSRPRKDDEETSSDSEGSRDATEVQEDCQRRPRRWRWRSRSFFVFVR
jgi:hypothetical protein